MLHRPSQECMNRSYSYLHLTQHQQVCYLLWVNPQPCQMGRAGIVICTTIFFVSLCETAGTQGHHAAPGCPEVGIDPGRPKEPALTLRPLPLHSEPRGWCNIGLSFSHQVSFSLKHPPLTELLSSCSPSSWTRLSFPPVWAFIPPVPWRGNWFCSWKPKQAKLTFPGSSVILEI